MKSKYAKVGLLCVALLCTSEVSAQTTYTQEDLEELAYSIGLSQTRGLREYLTDSLGVENSYFDSFAMGLVDGAKQAGDKEKEAYYVGIQIGLQIVTGLLPGINKELFGDDSTKTMPQDSYMRGFLVGLQSSSDAAEEAEAVAQQKISFIKSCEVLQKYNDNKIAGEEFLANNKNKEGVKILSDGVQYKILKKGTGALPKESSMVRIHYEGRTIDGNIFNSTYEKEPETLCVNQMLAGFATALVNMPVGSIWEVYIPQEMAYAEREIDGIKPFSALIFKVELLGIE